jgi:HSP20 family protein
MLTKFHPFNDFFNWNIIPSERSWIPSVDIREDDGSFYVDMELTGMTQEDIDLSIKDNTLTVKGERKAEKKEGTDYNKIERYYGSFMRSFTLPTSADQEKVEALFEKGLLTIKIDKKARKIPKQIKIKSR